MSVNGVSGAKDYPWYCGWLITCNDSGDEEVDAVTGAAPRTKEVASNKKGINPSFPGVACAANEADVAFCEGALLNVFPTLLDPEKTLPAEGATARWRLTIKDCNNDDVFGASVRCNFNEEDSGYDDELEFKAEEGKSSIVVEHHVGKENSNDGIACQVNEGEGETTIYKPDPEPVKAEVINPSQCDYAGNKPSYGGISLDLSSLDNSKVILVPQKVKIIISGVKDCEGNTGEYLEVFVGSDEVLATNMGNGTYVAEYEVTDICSSPFTSRIVIEDNNKGTKAETVAYFSDISCSAAETATDTCALPNVGSIQVEGLDPVDGTVVSGAPVTFSIEVKGCDSDNSDIESVVLQIGTVKYDMADEDKDTIYEKTLPAAIWGAPIRIVVTKKIGDKTIEVVRELWTVPTVITKPDKGACQGNNIPIYPEFILPDKSTVTEKDLATGVEIIWEPESQPALVNCDGSYDELTLICDFKDEDKTLEFTPDELGNLVIKKTIYKALASEVACNLKYVDPETSEFVIIQKAVTLYGPTVVKPVEQLTQCDYSENPIIVGNITLEPQENIVLNSTVKFSFPRGLISTCDGLTGKGANSPLNVVFNVGNNDHLAQLDDPNYYYVEVPVSQVGNQKVFMTVTDTSHPDSVPQIISQDYYVKQTADVCDNNKVENIGGLGVKITTSKPGGGMVYFGDPVTFYMTVTDCNEDIGATIEVALDVVDANNMPIVLTRIPGTNKFEATNIPAAYWGPITATVYKNGSSVGIAPIFFGVPTVIPKNEQKTIVPNLVISPNNTDVGEIGKMNSNNFVPITFDPSKTLVFLGNELQEDKGPLTYTLLFGDGSSETFQSGTLVHPFPEGTETTVVLTVKDAEGNSAKSNVYHINLW